jgi:putative flippase GtrA
MSPLAPPRQLVAFVAVGLAATATHAAFALCAHKLLGLPPLAANLVGYAFAILVSYAGNARVTFRRPLLHPEQFGRFVAISLAALALNEGLVYVFSGRLRLPFAEALVPVVLVVPAFTFVTARLWAFVEKGSPRAAHLEPRRSIP